MNLFFFKYKKNTDRILFKVVSNATAAAAKSLQSCPTLATPWTAAHQAPLSMGFPRQEHWSGVPLPSPVSNAR